MPESLTTAAVPCSGFGHMSLGSVPSIPSLLMQRSGINPQIYQQFLESAANAGNKGQAAFFTPPEWAEVLAIPLPRYRPTVVDLTCGSGRLLYGASLDSTNHRLGCDIDPGDYAEGVTQPAYSGQLNGVQRIAGDVCKIHPLLRAVHFEGDCWVLNPPWDLHWYRAALGAMLESELPTVRKASRLRLGGRNRGGRSGRSEVHRLRWRR